MAAYNTFGSHILFKQLLDDELGHLYRAGDFDKTGIKQTVFLRVFDSARVPKAELIAAFDDATRIGEIFQATNVVSSPTLSEIDGTPALAYEYVPSQPLSRVFEKVNEEGFPVPVDNALLIMEKLALALSSGLAVEIGGTSMVHGFVHPSLVLVTNDGEGQLAGFGLAEQLLSLVDDPSAANGVHPYLAPEVLLSRTSSRQSDVYSLGSILYQLLTGQPLPTNPEDRTGIIDRAELAYDERPIPDDIKALLARALARRPEDRFSSAADFKKELDKLLYGGAYSPTTFNLALFMDRLFREEIEAEDSERAKEDAVDVAAYLKPEPEPEPVEILPEPQAPKGGGRGLIIGSAAAAVVVAAVVGFVMMDRSPSAPPIPPTPSPEEIAAQRAAQEERLKELASKMVEEQMAQKEEELRSEMLGRQQKIEELQRRLRETEAKASLSNQEKVAREKLQREIAAEEEAKRQQEADAEAERLRLIEEARKQAAAQQSATATAVAETALAAAASAKAVPTKAPINRVVEGQQQQQASGAAATGSEIKITENMFLEPTQVDTLPVVLKDHPVEWPRSASRSRRNGMVIVQATVNADGLVEDVKILRADEKGLGIPQAVIEAVRKFRFKPATKNGVKVKSHATVTERFTFSGR